MIMLSRCVRLARDMVGVVRQMSRNDTGLDLHIRVGIASGPLMAGDYWHPEVQLRCVGRYGEPGGAPSKTPASVDAFWCRMRRINC